jgi:hypothetical protein
MKSLSASQIKKLKNEFEKNPQLKYSAIQGNISALMELSQLIGEGLNYSIVQKNIKSLI